MSKIKILDLMKKKELVSRQSASDVVGKLNAELEKCASKVIIFEKI
jgi:hypothetical protein